MRLFTTSKTWMVVGSWRSTPASDALSYVDKGVSIDKASIDANLLTMADPQTAGTFQHEH